VVPGFYQVDCHCFYTLNIQRWSSWYMDARHAPRRQRHRSLGINPALPARGSPGAVKCFASGAVFVTTSRALMNEPCYERRPDGEGEGPRRPGGGEIARRRRGAGVTGRRIIKVMRGAPRSVSGSCLRDLETGTASEKLSVHANRIHTSSLAAGEPKHNAVAAWQPHRPTRGRGSNSATATAATRSASYARCAGPTLSHASSASA
jgi:hypothetical protein